MRFAYLILTLLAVGVSASRRAPVVESSGRRGASVFGGAHFGWGMPMDDRPMEEEQPQVKEGA